MKQRTSPYLCHLFICTKSRNGEKKSCGDAGTPALKAELKKEIKARGWKHLVRVSDTGCLGVCATGPNIMLYPQKIWLSGVAPSDLPNIIQIVEGLVGSEA